MMIEEIANTVFMVAFGLFIGSTFGLFTALSESLERPGERALQLRKNKEDSLKDYFRKLHAQVDEDNKRNIEEIATWPRSMKIVLSIFMAFVVVLVLVINFTTIRMSWPIFLGTAFGACVVCILIFRRVSEGTYLKKKSPTDNNQ